MFLPQCTYYRCSDEQNDLFNLTRFEKVDCFYFSWREDTLYINRPQPFTWYTSAGFHSVFWPALAGGLFLITFIVKKLFNIAKSTARAEEIAMNAPPPTYSPNLYVIGSESARGMILGVEKSEHVAVPSLEGCPPSAPEYIYSLPPEYTEEEEQTPEGATAFTLGITIEKKNRGVEADEHDKGGNDVEDAVC